MNLFLFDQESFVADGSCSMKPFRVISYHKSRCHLHGNPDAISEVQKKLRASESFEAENAHEARALNLKGIAANFE